MLCSLLHYFDHRDIVLNWRRVENGESGRWSAGCAEEGVRPSLQVAADRRQRRGEDMRTLQIRGRYVQHDLHLDDR